MSSQMISCSITDDGTATVTVSGAVSIESCSELHRALSEAVEGSCRVVLDLSGLEAIDMTALQVICSACRSAAAQQKELSYAEGRVPDCLASAGRNIGACRGTACSANISYPCIWSGGTT